MAARRLYNTRPVRRSQAIVPFGVGAMVDFPGESLMAAGLDAWKEGEFLDDPRFAERLRVKRFRQPPPAPQTTADKAGYGYLPFVRFPRWHVCLVCRQLVELAWNAQSVPPCDAEWAPPWRKRPCAELQEGKRPRRVPQRFVVACTQGHIEDFPWVGWAHKEKGTQLVRGKSCGDPRLTYESRGSAGLGGLHVHCHTCGKGRSLLGASKTGALAGMECTAHRPWLGPQGEEDGKCGQPMRMLQRGGTNVYFAQVASSILIPQYSSKCRRVLEVPRIWNRIVQSEGPRREAHVESAAEDHGIPLQELGAAVAQKLAPPVQHADESEEDYRRAEYRALLRGNTEDTEDLVVERVELQDYGAWLSKHCSEVLLAERITETRALTGFQRVQPGPSFSAPRSGEKWLSLRRLDWLPAVRVFGEGIFISLRRGRVIKFEELYDSRAGQLEGHLRAARGRIRSSLRPAFVLLHTLSHLLIRRLAFECGYGAAALRERLYCTPPEWDEWMCGVLIYTASGDAEGTLGGLVQQGRPGQLERILRGAVADARWCSSDPLCQESRGQGTDSLNLAACHACALLPETSCELGNRLLDRVSVVGTTQDPDGGFFDLAAVGSD